MRRSNDDPKHRQQSGPGAPTSKADHAYTTILRSILDGEYEPGERLVIERLARELGVSVVPVREAIRRLEADGYVTFTRNIGATVTAIDLDRYPETIEAVAAIEGVALGLAAPHLTATDMRRAREVNDRLRDSLAKFDPTQFTRLNRRFHEILYGACPNRHILTILEREWALLDTHGVIVAVFFEELDDRKVRVSMRSKTNAVDVCAICQKFGGGGHTLAAGARVRGALAEVEEKVLEEIGDALKSHS